MGRIRTKAIKRLGRTFVKDFEKDFSVDFQKNKKRLDEVSDIYSKKLRNKIAGYITKLTKTPKI